MTTFLSIAQVKKLAKGDLILIDFNNMAPGGKAHMLVIEHCKVVDFLTGKIKSGLALVSLKTQTKGYLAYEHLAWTWTTQLISKI